MTLTAPRLLGPDGRPFKLDPDLDAPLVGPSVLAAVGDSMGGAACSAWRVLQPFTALQLRGYPAEWGFYEHPGTIRLLPVFDALILCRLGWLRKDRRGVKRQIDRWHRAGKRLLYECDDDLFSPFMVRQQKAGIAAEMPIEELERQRQDSLWTMQQCDGVTVSTQRLASVVRQYTDAPVAVVPNAIDAEWFQAVQRHGTRPVEGLTIGWAGGRRPDADLTAMAVAWGRIARRYPDVTFVLAGAQPPVVWEHVPAPRLKAVPWRNMYEYPLSLVGIDIGCCPLEDRPFNRCKTGIKAYEYALSGAAVVASPTVYGQCIEDGENGLLARDADDWEAHLAFLVEHADARAALAAALKADVLEKWSLRKNYWRWPMSWRRLLEEGA